MSKRPLLIVICLLIPAAAESQAYGPDTCKTGFVWREVTPDDHVCVLPEIRAQVRRDNAQAAYRISRDNQLYGPQTCRQGYVWREATADDRVCVLPATRDQARRDNEAAPSRYVNQ